MIDTVIVGAGPYGLSIAAHLRRRGVPFRIVGRPMDSWKSHMPAGMMLKSDGFASNISDPDEKLTLKQFCAGRGINYSDTQIPVSLETFIAYGLAFAEQMVPELEDKLVVALDRTDAGFAVKLDTGEAITARRIVMAVGITHFEFVPSSLTHLPAEFLSHSFRHHDLKPLRDREVVVIGGGASATDLAGLLGEAGAEVQLVARETTLRFHSPPTNARQRTLWQRLRRPQSGLGPGWRSRLYSDWPVLFRHFPDRVRSRIVRQHLGPAGGWFAKEKVVGKLPLHLGFTPEHVDVENERVRVRLRGIDGAQRYITAQHIIAATGYKVDMERLTFLSKEIRSSLKTVDGSPVLSSKFESSVPGLYFVGIAAANSFGPLMRFAFGAEYTADRLARSMAKSLARNPEYAAASRTVTIAK